MYILGLTGPIASGKSKVESFFYENSIPCIDADNIVHECYRKGTIVYSEMLNLFGNIILDDKNNIDRKKLLKIIKDDADNLKLIENIVYPQLRIIIKSKLESFSVMGVGMVVLSVPLMFENGFNKLCDKVIVCSCSERNRKHRFMLRDGSNESKWVFINNKQMSMSEYIKYSDIVIDTDCPEIETKMAVLDLITSLSGELGSVWYKEWRKII